MILFARFAARVEDETAELCDVRKGDGGAGSVGGQEKEWTGCLLDDLRVFDIKADQATTVAQDEGEWRRRRNKGLDVSWLTGLLQTRPGLDYGMQLYMYV